MCFKTETEVERTTKQIDKIIRKDRKNNYDTGCKFVLTTLLLLGPENSGKSTFIKQMRILYQGGYSDVELNRYKLALRENCINSIQTLLKSEKVILPETLLCHKKSVLACNGSTLDQCCCDIEILWSHPIIKEAYDKSTEFPITLPTNAAYFLQNVRKFSYPDFIPNHQDIINSRLKTNGISTIVFPHQGLEFTIIDIAGQKSDSRKWLHCFDNVNAVIFVVPLDEYDIKTGNKNKLEEIREEWTSMSRHQQFEDTSWILFLNKTDLFEIKLKKAPLKQFFPDAPDTTEVKAASNYILSYFTKAFKGKVVYPYITCITNTDLTEQIFQAVSHTVINRALSHAGF